MSKQMEVSLKQAVEMAEMGYTVKHFVMLDRVSSPTQKDLAFKKKFVPADALIALSVEHLGPSKGKMVGTWAKVKKTLWERDATAVHARSAVDTAIRASGGSASDFAYLCNKLHCIRVVEKQHE